MVWCMLMLLVSKKCWKGSKKQEPRKLFGKTYNRCEKIKKEAEMDLQEAIPGYEKYDDEMKRISKKTYRKKDLIDALKASCCIKT